MVQNALAASVIIYAGIVAVILKECMFLAPAKKDIWENCGETIIWFSVLLLLNLFAAIYGLLRRLSLKDTGDKLAHVEKQLRGRRTISEELTERIMERK